MLHTCLKRTCPDREKGLTVPEAPAPGGNGGVTLLSRSELHKVSAAREGLRAFHRWSGNELQLAGLTPALHDLLLTVKAVTAGGKGGPSIARAAAALALTHHSTVELANRAEAAGFVRRASDAQDRRVVRLVLTPSGDQVLSNLAGHHREQLTRLRSLADATTRASR